MEGFPLEYNKLLMPFGQVATFIPLGMIRSVENKTTLTLAFLMECNLICKIG
jgi:hypothetical protein